MNENDNLPKSWGAFLEGEALDFFDKYDLEKMSLEDGEGNKAKFSRVREGGVKIEQSSTIVI